MINKKISLALQGGGAHGAFTWGVLDRLLEDERIEFEAASGASAGAMNAAVLASGWLQGGRDGAKKALDAFWRAVALASPVDLSGGKDLLSGGYAPMVRAMMLMMNQLAPALINPFAINPLERIVKDHIDFDALRAGSIKLSIAATHARSGRLRIFRTPEISPDVLLASGCLPFIHHTVVIDGEPYWDGAYSANPALSPLIHEADTRDILIVMLRPLEFGGVPHTGADIQRRITDIGFSAGFLREIEGVCALRAAVDARAPGARLGIFEERVCSARFHLIESDELMGTLSGETRLMAHGPFLDDLKQEGRDHAEDWLAKHFDKVGRCASIDLEDTFFPKNEGAPASV